MCNVVLAGSNREFKYLNNVIVLSDRIDVYDYQDKLIMTLPQGNQDRKEFEVLSYWILYTLESSLEFPCDDSLAEIMVFRSFCNPDSFFDDMPKVYDSLDESLERIEDLKRMGVDTSGMAEFANSYWSTHGKA